MGVASLVDRDDGLSNHVIGFIEVDAPRACWWHFEKKKIARFAVEKVSVA
jgi:hypothetical protein